MKRLPVVSYRSTDITPDTAEALRQLELSAAQIEGASILYQGGVKRTSMGWDTVKVYPGHTRLPPALSMLPTGREVCLRLNLKGPTESHQRALTTLWGLVIPLGFTPWLRYPLVQDKLDMVFHYFGPWRMLFDHLHGEGRGEYAWESVAAAAQSDVGMWQGSKAVERFVQAQLHRLGFHCGLVDGIIGHRTTQALNALGIKGKPLTEVAEYLAEVPDMEVPAEARTQGHIVLPGRPFQIEVFGGIHPVRTPHGVALTIDGPGKVMLDVGGSDTDSLE